MTIQKDTVFATPPVAVSAGYLSGITMADVVIYLTAAYTAVLLAHNLWKWRNEYKDRKSVKYGRRSTDAQLDEE